MLRMMLSRTFALCALLCLCVCARAQAGNGSGFAEVNGTKLFYEARGSGPFPGSSIAASGTTR